MARGSSNCTSRPSFSTAMRVAKRHRLFLVVGDEDEGLVQLALQAIELCSHVKAQQRVEVGQRLVHQADRRFPHQCAGHGDALRLAARQLRRLAVQIVADPADRSATSLTDRSMSAAGTFRIRSG